MIIKREQLIDTIKNASRRIRVLGAVAFDLPYEQYREDWLNRINKGDLQVEIVCESESLLSYASLISADKRVSGEPRSYDIGTFLNKQRAPLAKVREFLKKNNCMHIEPEEYSYRQYLGSISQEERDAIHKKQAVGDFDMAPFRQLFSLRTCFLHIPVPVLNVDDDYFITHALTRFCSHEKYEQITEDNVWFEEYHRYFNAYLDSPLGATKYSTEVTAKDDKTEVILMYNDRRHVLGQLPRDSFLGSTKVKVVVWGMLFARDGRVLIHKRGENAKDNQGMWDKSIGGHVDMEKDVVDTVKAASREMLEELYKVEQAGQGGHSTVDNMEVNEDKPIFLGEWRPVMRYTLPFSEIRSKKDETFFFRISYDFSKQVIDSPRILPDGSASPVKVFADVYVFVMPESFNTVNLKNSKYLLLEAHELNDSYLEGQIFFNDSKVPFTPTPDLKKILTGSLWAELNSFADYLKGE